MLIAIISDDNIDGNGNDNDSNYDQSQWKQYSCELKAVQWIMTTTTITIDLMLINALNTLNTLHTPHPPQYRTCICSVWNSVSRYSLLSANSTRPPTIRYDGTPPTIDPLAPVPVLVSEIRWKRQKIRNNDVKKHLKIKYSVNTETKMLQKELKKTR